MDLNCKTYNHVAVVSNKCKPSSFIGEHLVEFIRSLSNWQNWKQLLVQFSEIISWWSQIILQSFIPKFRCLLRFNLLKSNSSHFQASANCERVKNIWKSIFSVSALPEPFYATEADFLQPTILRPSTIMQSVVTRNWFFKQLVLTTH